MRDFILVGVLAMTAACATAPAEQAVTAAPVIAAERAFAADAAVRGWAAAFRRAAAHDAITLSPGPVNAQENLAQFEGDGETTLDWRPAYAGIARSGDFGFTTGPFQFRGREGIVGHYFTVWRMQADGSWKWIFDAGTDVRDSGPAVAMDADIPMLPVAVVARRTAAGAIAEVRALEAAEIFDLSSSLAADARVNRVGRAPAIGAEAARTASAADPVATIQPIRADASEAGDMVFTLAQLDWRDGETPRRGYAARVWQRRPEGWRVVFDEIVPHRGPLT
jgi:ketosteroid isomerase-like protein